MKLIVAIIRPERLEAVQQALELAATRGIQGRVLPVSCAFHTPLVAPAREPLARLAGQLLGPSPSWYKSFAYRSRAVREPRAVLAEFGLELPDSTEIRVWDANSEARYLVLPLRADGADEMDENELASLVTRNGLIGTASR